MELLHPFVIHPCNCKDAAIARDHHHHHQDPPPARVGAFQIAFWYLFAAVYLALFLFNVSITSLQFADGSIDAAEAATSFVFSVSGLAVAVALFLSNTCLLPHAWVWMLFSLFALAALGRATLLFSRQHWAFSVCFGIGSAASLLLTRCTWHDLPSVDSYLPIDKSAQIV